MSCCWKPIAQRQNVIGFNTASPQTDGSGAIPLTAYPDCRPPYNGEYRDQTVYIVGWRTEHERLFLSTDAKAAVIYRNEIDRNLTLVPVSASQLCAQAVDDLYAAHAV